MSQSVPTGTAANTVTGSETGGDLAQTIAQAVAALTAVSTSLSETTAKMNQLADSISESVTQNVAKTSADDSVSAQNVVNGAYDPYENMRRDRTHYDQINQLSVQALAVAVETMNMIGKQGVRHADAFMAQAGYTLMNTEGKVAPKAS